jgi:hypothetical protein
MLPRALAMLRENLRTQRQRQDEYGHQMTELATSLLAELDLLDTYFDLNGQLEHLTKQRVISSLPPGPISNAGNRCALCNCDPINCP